MNCAECDSPLVCRYDDRHQCLLQWTNKPPTEPGWYWVKAKPSAPLGPRAFVHELDDDDIREGLLSFYRGSVPFDQIEYWLRIEAPEVPK